MSKKFIADDHLKQFAARLEKEIASYGEFPGGDAQERQRQQLVQLLKLEDTFRKTLIADECGREVYQRFITFICEDRRNILDGRPYFRERQKIFTRSISPAFKAKNEEGLYRFRINYQFITFALSVLDWSKQNPMLPQLAGEIELLRNEIIEMNMPLVMNRARLFWNRTPKSHLTLMDFLQIGCLGFISGVDKYVPLDAAVVPRSFRGVAIGRMTGNFIEEYCVDPATKVLKADLCWVRADVLAVGDEIIAFDENKPGKEGRRKWRKATVTSTGLRDLPKREIVTEGAAVVVSDGHMFLCAGGKAAEWGKSLRARSESPEQKGLGHRWVRADQLEPGDEILFFGPTWGTETGQHHASGVHTWCVGGIYDALRFLGEVRPDRLLLKAERVYQDKAIGRGRKLDNDSRQTRVRVLTNKSVGVGAVVTLGTSTKTLITNGLLSHNSETSMHFFPTDKRKIYSANKMVHKHTDGVDFEKLSEEVNAGFKYEAALMTTPSEIATLLSAASTVSADSTAISGENYVESVARFAAPDDCRPDYRMEEKDAMQEMCRIMAHLTLFEKKFLRLKGVPVPA